MKFRIAIAACALALAGSMLSAPPASAFVGSRCAGYYMHAAHVKWAAFAGHWIVTDFRWCSYRKKGFIGPVRGGVRGMTKPVLTHPSSGPFSYGETLSTERGPYHYSTSKYRFEYRFVMNQGHVATPGLHNHYAMKVQIRRANSPIARICYVARACSKWQN